MIKLSKTDKDKRASIVREIDNTFTYFRRTEDPKGQRPYY